MKTILLVSDDKAQLILKPESTFEREALKGLYEASPDGMVIRKGSFSECAGGYWREYREDDDFILTAIRPSK